LLADQGESIVTEVKPDQVWEIKAENGWRRAQVINVLGNEVELKYLDMSDAPDLARSLGANRIQMLGEPNRYRLVTSPP
jgi:hypothetical protein